MKDKFKSIPISAVIVVTLMIITGAQTFVTAATPPVMFADSPPAAAALVQEFPVVAFLMRRIADRLDLSTEQRDEIRSIVKEQMPTIKPLIKQLMETRQQLAELNKQDSFNEAEVQRLAEQQGATMTQLVIAKQRTLYRIRQVLTEEQQQEVDKIQSRIQARMQHWLNR